jgi:hypothetical protein
VVCDDFFMLYDCYITSFNLVCCYFVHYFCFELSLMTNKSLQLGMYHFHLVVSTCF